MFVIPLSEIFYRYTIWLIVFFIILELLPYSDIAMLEN